MQIGKDSLRNLLIHENNIPGFPSSSIQMESPVIATLLSLLSHDKDAYVRSEAATHLGRARTRSRKILKGLAEALKRDPQWLVRLCCAESLAKLPSHSSISALRSALYDKNPLVRGYAAASLARMPRAKQSKAWISARLNTETLAAARLRMLAALYSLGHQKSLRELLEFLEHEKPSIVKATANCLMDMVSSKPEIPLFCLVEQLFRRRRGKPSDRSVRMDFSAHLKELERIWPTLPGHI